MRFPELSHEGGPAHREAQRRLAVARDCHRVLVDRRATAGEAEQPALTWEVERAAADVDAREVWLGWVELGV